MPTSISDPGIISLNSGGSVFATHFKDDLFVDDGMGNLVLAITSGHATLSDGFAGSLAVFINTYPNAKIDLGSNVKLEIVADADELILLGLALKDQNLSLDDVFPGAGDLKVVIDEQDPNKLIQLSQELNPEFFGITEFKVPASGTLQLVVGFYDPATDYTVYDDITLIGSGDDIRKFLESESELEVPSSVRNLVDSLVVTGSAVYFGAQEFVNDNYAISLMGTVDNQAELQINGNLLALHDSSFVTALGNITEGSYSLTLLDVYDTATNITNAVNDTMDGIDLGTTIHGKLAYYIHEVEAITDTVTLFDGTGDWLYLKPAALVEGGTFTVNGNFEAFADVIDISNATQIFDLFTEDSNDQDFSFIAEGQSFNSHIGPATNTDDRVDIRITSGSVTIEFDGLLETSNYGTPDFTVSFPDTLGTEADSLAAFHFFGIPFYDEITLADFNDTVLIPDTELSRFAGLALYADSSTLWDNVRSIENGSATAREQLVNFGVSTDGLFARQPDLLVDTDDNLSFIAADDPSPDVLIGDGGDDTLTGGGNDTVSGGIGNDSLLGGDGDDELYGGSDNDILDGGIGDDQLYGDDGDDHLSGDDGDDQLYGESGNDTLLGGLGNDTIYGSEGNDMLVGGIGHDTLYSSSGNDTLSGGEGNDQLFADEGNDSLLGGQGNDTLYGDEGNDTLLGGQGNDTLYAGIGNDWIEGGTGNDIVFTSFFGDNDYDTVYAGDGSDTIFGSDSDDLLFGEGDADTIYAGDGVNTISGGEGNDVIYGGSEDDYAAGDSGDDVIWGGGGFDTLDGGDGNDVIIGEDGPDVLDGGSGEDVFSYTRKAHLGDSIQNFSTKDDRIDLDFGLFSSFTTSSAAPFLTTWTFPTPMATPVTHNVIYVLENLQNNGLVSAFYTSDGTGLINSGPIPTAMLTHYGVLDNPKLISNNVLTDTMASPSTAHTLGFRNFLTEIYVPVSITHTVSAPLSNGYVTNPQFFAFALVDTSLGSDARLLMAHIQNTNGGYWTGTKTPGINLGSRNQLTALEILSITTIASFTSGSFGNNNLVLNYYNEVVLI